VRRGETTCFRSDFIFFPQTTIRDQTRCPDLVTSSETPVPWPLRVCVTRVTAIAMTRWAARSALPPASKADSAPSKEEKHKRNKRHPKCRTGIGVFLHGIKIVGLFADVDVEGDIDGECDEGEEGGEEGYDGGEEGDCDVFGEGEEEGDEDEYCCDGVEDETAGPGGADGLDVVPSAELGELDGVSDFRCGTLPTAVCYSRTSGPDTEPNVRPSIIEHSHNIEGFNSRQ